MPAHGVRSGARAGRPGPGTKHLPLSLSFWRVKLSRSRSLSLFLGPGTKYLGGHNDVLCGALAGRKELIAKVRGARGDKYRAIYRERGGGGGEGGRARAHR